MNQKKEQQSGRDPGETSRAGAQGRTSDAGTGGARESSDDGSTPREANPRTGGSGLANEVGMPDEDGTS